MNNHHSPSFATVFFLVVLFIGMGALSYHAIVITVENEQLNETVGTLQANVATLNLQVTTLKTENISLRMMNSELMTENTALTAENNELRIAFEKSVTEKSDPYGFDADKVTELETLCLENLQLKGQQGGGGRSSLTASGVLQSSILPTDLEFWIMAAAIASLAVALFAGYMIYTGSKTRGARRLSRREL